MGSGGSTLLVRDKVPETANSSNVADQKPARRAFQSFRKH